MANGQTSLADLSQEDRQMLEVWLTEFDQSWEDGLLARLVRLLPPRESPLRYPALLELVKIDLKHRWQRNQQWTSESYIISYPELGSADEVPLDLVVHEFQVRRQTGAPAIIADFLRRFPRQAELLKQKLEALSGPTETARPASTTGVDLPGPPSFPGPIPSYFGEVPEQIGPYKILKKLGQGGMGSVYLAQDTRLDRQVALKVPHFTVEDGPEILARFHREARAAATVQHPNICPVFDIGEANGTHYMAMAYIEGRPLKDLANSENPLPQKQAAEIIRKIAVALEEAHSKNVIHRDLKPTNVMIAKNGEPIILDFGLARRMNTQSMRLTRTGAVLGTPAYMAPEQVTIDAKQVGPSCDIYSLGVMLYELLTGRVPFEGPIAAIIGRLLMEEPAPPSSLRAGIDPRLEEICLKAMAKKPANRFASMREMADALAAYLQDSHTPPPPQSAALAKPKTQVAPVVPQHRRSSGAAPIVPPQLQNKPMGDSPVRHGLQPQPYPASSSRSFGIILLTILAVVVFALAFCIMYFFQDRLFGRVRKKAVSLAPPAVAKAPQEHQLFCTAVKPSVPSSAKLGGEKVCGYVVAGYSPRARLPS